MNILISKLYDPHGDLECSELLKHVAGCSGTSLESALPLTFVRKEGTCGEFN